MSRLKLEDLQQNPDYELLADLEHQQVKQFILEQLSPLIRLMKYYSFYQVLMVLLLLAQFGYSVAKALTGETVYLKEMAWALLFSFTLLVVLHEGIHAVAYRLFGVKKLRAGAIWQKFIFYVAADRQVVDYKTFRVVAFAPLLVVKAACLLAIILIWPGLGAWFAATVMFIHSLFCAGDMALLAFYQKNGGHKLYSFDDLQQGKTYFYLKR